MFPLLFTLAYLGSAACGQSEPVEAIVCVELDARALAAARTARVRIQTQEGDESQSVTFAGGQPDGATPNALLPFRIPLAADDASRTFNVEIVLLDASSSVIATQDINGGFINGNIARYRMRFDNECAGGGTCAVPVQDALRVTATLDELCPAPVVSSSDAVGLPTDEGDPRFSAPGQGHWYFGFYESGRDEDMTYSADEFRYGARVGFDVDVTSDTQRNDAGCWAELPTSSCEDATGGGARFLLIDDAPHILGLPQAGLESDENIFAIRRWVAPKDTCVAVRYELAFRDIPCLVGVDADCTVDRDPRDLADGIDGYVWLEGFELANVHLDPYEGANRRRDRLVFESPSTCLSRGERLDFGVGAGMYAAFDPFTMRVTLAEVE